MTEPVISSGCSMPISVHHQPLVPEHLGVDVHSVLVSVFLVRHTYAVLVVAALLHAQPLVFQVFLQHRSKVLAPPHPHLHPSILQQIAPKPLRVVPHPTLGLPLHHLAVEPQVHRPHAPTVLILTLISQFL